MTQSPTSLTPRNARRVAARKTMTMKIDCSANIFTMEGKAFKKDDTPNSPDWTMGAAAATALLGGREGGLNKSQVVDVFQLAFKVNAGGKIDLSAEEIVSIKDAAAAHLVPLVGGQVVLHFDGKPSPFGKADPKAAD